MPEAAANTAVGGIGCTHIVCTSCVVCTWIGALVIVCGPGCRRLVWGVRSPVSCSPAYFVANAIRVTLLLACSRRLWWPWSTSTCTAGVHPLIDIKIPPDICIYLCIKIAQNQIWNVSMLLDSQTNKRWKHVSIGWWWWLYTLLCSIHRCCTIIDLIRVGSSIQCFNAVNVGVVSNEDISLLHTTTEKTLNSLWDWHSDENIQNFRYLANFLSPAISFINKSAPSAVRCVFFSFFL